MPYGKKPTAIADSVDVVLSKPRVASCSRYRNNAGGCESDNAVEYYRINVYFPFIDHCESLFLRYKLLPSKISSLTEDDIDAIEQFYGPDFKVKSKNGRLYLGKLISQVCKKKHCSVH